MKNRIFYLLLVSNLIAANEGIETGNNLRSHFSGNFQSNVSAPLTSNADFKTVNSSKSFSANLTCKDTVNPFLEISYSGTSDITINVNIDTDLNGTKDKTFSYSGISGVGANGVIKCDSNTWNNCKYFLWSLSNNNLILQESTLSQLGGIYCINSSCGNISSTRKSSILDTIGGAISSMYQSSNSNYLITKTKNNGNEIIFFGQNYQNCQNYQGNINQNQNLDTTNIINTQSNDKSSPYYVLNKSVENQNNNNFDNDVKQTIDIRNSVSVKGNTNDYTFSYTGKQKNEDGSWTTKNSNAKVNIDFLNPNIKYCEIKYLEENTTIFTDGKTHHSSSGDKQTWKTKIVECTGNSYDNCPIDSNKGELIKHPCGDIDNFAEATSILTTVSEAANDFSCSK